MPEPFEQMAGLDRLVHEPARLAILTALSACESADFLFLQRLTGLTKGNLSSHLSKLEAADLIWVRKEASGRKPRTICGLREAGRTAIDAHWERLETLRRDARQWRPAFDPGTA